MSKYQFFSEAELACRCGKCGMGQDDMDPEFMENVVDLRIALGFPLPVTSAIRCPAHNNKVSSTGLTGPHTTGKAIDFGVHGERAYKLLAAAAASYNFTGLGVRQKGNRGSRFIHLDSLQPGETKSPRPWVWSY